MKAVIKSYSVEGEELDNYWPDDTSDFCIEMDVTVGVQGKEGGDIFSFEVCSPKWFQKNRAQHPAFSRHILFVNEYDDCAIKETIGKLVSEASGETWDDITNILSRFMFWEFEDYEKSYS